MLGLVCHFAHQKRLTNCLRICRISCKWLCTEPTYGIVDSANKAVRNRERILYLHFKKFQITWLNWINNKIYFINLSLTYSLNKAFTVRSLTTDLLCTQLIARPPKLDQRFKNKQIKKDAALTATDRSASSDMTWRLSYGQPAVWWHGIQLPPKLRPDEPRRLETVHSYPTKS